MLLQSKIFIFPLDEIVKCSTSLLWQKPPETLLLLSLEAIGQIEPLFVRTVRGKKELVSGYSRLLALKELGKKEAVCVELTGSDAECGLFYLQANYGRECNDGMRLAALRFFMDLAAKGEFSVTQLENEVLPLLGIAFPSQVWKWWREWLAFSPDIDCLLQNGNVPLACVSVLAQFSKCELQAMMPFLQAVNWSKSNAEHFLTWLFEAGRFREKSVQELLSDAVVILQKDLSPKDLTAMLLRYVQKLRYPNLTRMQNELQKRLSALTKGGLWQAEHEENFERRSLFIRGRFHSAEDVRRASEELLRLADFWEDERA